MRAALVGNGVSRFFAPFYKELDSALRERRYADAGKRKAALVDAANESIVEPLAQIAHESATIDPRQPAYPLGHHAVAFLAATGHYDAIVTTNYDSFIDRSLEWFCRTAGTSAVLNPAVRISGRSEQYGGFINQSFLPGDAIPYWKIHGDANYWRWLCCDQIERAAAQPLYREKLQEHFECSTYRLGAPVFNVLLPGAEANDAVFLGLINGAADLLQSALDSDGEINVLGFTGRSTEQISVALGEAAVLAAGTSRCVIKYVNRHIDFDHVLPQSLQQASDRGLDVQFVEGDVDEWLVRLMDELGLRGVFDRHVEPDE